MTGACACACARACLQANSLSMMGDAVLMILDAVTYGANIYADYECAKPERKDDHWFRDRTHFAAALFSLVVISAVEVYVITDAVLRILAPVEDELPVNVSPKTRTHARTFAHTRAMVCVLVRTGVR